MKVVESPAHINEERVLRTSETPAIVYQNRPVSFHSGRKRRLGQEEGRRLDTPVVEAGEAMAPSGRVGMCVVRARLRHTRAAREG